MVKHYLRFMSAIALAGLIWTSAAWSDDFTDLTARDLKSKLDSGEKIVLLNPLSDIEFAAGHIPGSINIPLHLIPATTMLPSDPSTPIVIYCLGPK